MNDLRYAVRMLLKNPGFTVVALFTLALCIGANLSIFAVVDAILIRPLPFPDSNRLVILFNSYPKANIPRAGASLTSYYERRGQIPSFASLAAISQTTSVVGETGATSRENCGRVSPEFFATLGVNPFIGRTFKEEEMTYQTDHEAMLSYEYWQSHCNADPNILGKSIRADGIARLVVGVLPPGFRFLSFEAPVYTPLSSEEAERNLGARHAAIDKIEIARLVPGVTLAEAQSEVDAHNNARAAEFPQAKEVAETGFRTVVAPLHADHVASVRPILVLLQAGVLFLLLIGGANLANLLLIRAGMRTRELGIRLSLGATRRHVVSQVMAETVLLALGGGIAGLSVGAAGIRLLAALGVDQLPLGARIALNERLALVTLIGAVVMGIVIALPVAWFNLRGHPANALRTQSRGDTTNLAARRLRHAFIIAQIGLAFVLLTGAGLLGVSLKRAMEVSPGFRLDHVLTGQFGLPWLGYHSQGSFPQFFDRLYEEISHQPGVSAVGVVNRVPMSGEGPAEAVTVPGYILAPGASLALHDIFAVAGDYFAAMGVPLREGRYLNQTDTHGDQKPCVVDEAFAHRYWPQGGAIGKQVYEGTSIKPGDLPFVVVGVVGAVKQTSLTDNLSKGAIYVPYNRFFTRNYYLVTRTGIAPESLALTLIKTVRKIDPELPLNDLRSMDVRVEDSLISRRSPTLLAGIFALAALLLAAIGTYGVLSCAVAQRHREIGVRLALGAQPKQIAIQFLSLGLRLLAVGTVAGVLGACLAGQAMRKILINVPALPVATLAGTALIMTVVSLVACWLPVRRAARVDPMMALRDE